MNAAGWNRVKEIFGDAIELRADEREAFLSRSCGADADLRSQIELLLLADSDAGAFLAEPARDDSGGRSRPASSDSVAPHDIGETTGARIGRYTLLEPLGEGGFGAVYRAEQTEPVRRHVALKIIKPGMDSRQVVARFEAERQALALMDHPGIARVFDGGATAFGRPYFVMELVEGVPITRYCDERRLDEHERLHLFMRVLHAVQHAHQKGVVHRDLKPGNVLVGDAPDGPQVKVIDFGVAKAIHGSLTDASLTQQPQYIGTPAYMSPEQAAASTTDVDTRGDVYSLGALLYELLCGAAPFDAARLREAGLVEALRIVREEPPMRPSRRHPHLRGDLEWILLKAMAKDRTHRYDTVSALAEDIRRHLDHEPVSAGPPARMYRFRKFVRRNRGLITAASVCFAALAAGLALALAGYADARRKHATAESARIAAEQARTQSQAARQFLADMLMQADPARTEGREITVREVLDRAAEQLAGAPAQPPEVEASLRTTIGQTYSNLGRYSDATPHLQRAAELHRQLDGEHDFQTLRARLRLADNLLLDGAIADAERLARESLAELRAGTSPEPELLARHLYTIGRLVKRQGDYPLASERFYEAAALLDGLPLAAGLRAQVLGELGVVRMRTDDLAEAESLLRDAVALARQTHGDRSAQAAGLLCNLAVAVKRAGRPEEAEAMYREALDVQLATHGPDHPATIGTRVNLGALLVARDAFAEAEPLLADAVTKVRELHGDDSVQFAMALGLHGRALLGLLRVDDAEQAVRTSLAVLHRTVGATHEHVATSLFDLGIIQLQREQWDAADASLHQALQIFRQRLGDDHPRLALVLEKLGELCYRRGDRAGGTDFFARALAIHENSSGANGPEVADCCAAWADCEQAAGDPAEAERLLHRATDIRRQSAILRQGSNPPERPAAPRS